MATAGKDIREPKPLPAPNSDFYYLYETLAPDELAIVKRVREFMESKVAPVITKYWVEDSFPFELLPAVKELGIGGVAKLCVASIYPFFSQHQFSNRA